MQAGKGFHRYLDAVYQVAANSFLSLWSGFLGKEAPTPWPKTQNTPVWPCLPWAACPSNQDSEVLWSQGKDIQFRKGPLFPFLQFLLIAAPEHPPIPEAF